MKICNFPNFNLYKFGQVLKKLSIASYPNSMTDSECKILETLLPPKPDTLRRRPQDYSSRSIVDGILCIIWKGGSWAMMPNDLPHWKTCNHNFRLWAKLDTGEDLLRDPGHGPPRGRKNKPLRLLL